MSSEAIAHVWDVAHVTAEEKLILLWIANHSPCLGAPVMVDPAGMGEFIGSDYCRAIAVVNDLVAKELVKWGTEEEETNSYVWLTYDGEYERPIDWTAETKSRSRRVAALIERDGAKCAYCDRMPVVYEVDHFIPRAKGGADTMNNLVLACGPCNRAKRDKMPEDFLRNRPKLFHSISTNLKYLFDFEDS